MLHKLTNAYLLYDNYEHTLNTICKEEGSISENNDSWIHRESGYVLKYIDFDSNYGFDEDGNIIQFAEEVPIDENDILELDEADLESEDLIDAILNKDNTIKSIKNIFK